MSTMLGVPLSKRSNSVSLSNVSNGFVSSGAIKIQMNLL